MKFATLLYSRFILPTLSPIKKNLYIAIASAAEIHFAVCLRFLTVVFPSDCSES